MHSNVCEVRKLAPVDEKKRLPYYIFMSLFDKNAERMHENRTVL